MLRVIIAFFAIVFKQNEVLWKQAYEAKNFKEFLKNLLDDVFEEKQAVADVVESVKESKENIPNTPKDKEKPDKKAISKNKPVPKEKDAKHVASMEKIPTNDKRFTESMIRYAKANVSLWKAMCFISNLVPETVSLQDLGVQAGKSKTYFTDLFRKGKNVTPEIEKFLVEYKPKSK